MWRAEKAGPAKALFGRPLRVLLAAWILARSDRFYLFEAQAAMGAYGEAGSGVAKELKTFEAHGMLVARADGGRIYFTATDSGYWEAFRAISASLGLV